MFYFFIFCDFCKFGFYKVICMENGKSSSIRRRAKVAQLYDENEQLKMELESRKKENEQREKDLENFKAQIDLRAKELENFDILIDQRKKFLRIVKRRLSSVPKIWILIDQREKDFDNHEAGFRAVTVENIKGLSSCRTSSGRQPFVGVKRMGELGQKSFQKACRLRFSAEESAIKSVELCSVWQQEVNNSK